MEEWIKILKRNAPGDKGMRLLVAGATVLLFLVVIIDALGARGRAMDGQRVALVRDDGAPTVPSVYQVPRDLASEAERARQLAQMDDAAADEIEIAMDVAEDVAEAGTAEDTASAMAEADAPLDEVETAGSDLTADDTTEAEMAEADTAEQTEAPEVADAAPAETVDAESEAEVAQTEPEAAAEDTTETAEAADAVESAQDTADAGGLAALASADIENGQRVWRQCAACHVHDAEQNRGGPHLVGIIGRDIGAAEGWRYSRALSEHGGEWSVDALLAWLENPDSYIPGNQMAFRGLRDEQDRIDVLGFLNASGTN